MTRRIDHLIRTDAAMIARIVTPGSRVLDLGCGDGILLSRLIHEYGCSGQGIDIDEANLIACVKKGLSVIQFDLDAGLGDFPDGSFDYVILNQTLQVITRPERVIAEMLRVGRRGIVGFPNFGYWRVRLQFVGRGRMPRTPALPFAWFDTPNIHQLTVRDLAVFCRERDILIREDHHCIGGRWRSGPLWRRLANWASATSIVVIEAGAS